jgi:hypothetical protein
MPTEQCRDSAADFRCKSPADPVLMPGIPLPDGIAKWHARPCYRAIIRRWRGDFPLSDANFSLPAGKTENSNVPTIMIAEKGAAMIKGVARQRLAA